MSEKSRFTSALFCASLAAIFSLPLAYAADTTSAGGFKPKPGGFSAPVTPGKQPIIAPQSFYGYKARQAKSDSSKSGAFYVSGVQWTCEAGLCSSKAPWATPNVGLCRQLVQQSGPVEDFGHDQEQLSPADIKACNAAAGQVVGSVQPPGSLPVSPSQTSGFASPRLAKQQGLGQGPPPEIRKYNEPALAPSAPQQTGSSGFSSPQLARQKGLNPNPPMPPPEMKRYSGFATARTAEPQAQSQARVAGGNDCDDNDQTIHPDQPELCDGVDNNCDGHIDEGCTSGQRTQTHVASTIVNPYGGTDCDDHNPSVHPGNGEVCNRIDDNCDGTIDEGCQR